MRIAELTDGIVAGDRRAVARALTTVERQDDRADALGRTLRPHVRGVPIVGVTGPPGVGKSTLVDAMITAVRAGGRTVGVLAVDPSSPLTGGALLGDRVRMLDHVDDPGVFVRSMASRGHLGGLAWATTQAADVLDAAGFDLVIIETVGIGQSEVEIAEIADLGVVVLAPGLGDDVQAIKAGILEVADVLIVNKADHPHAQRAVRQLMAMLSLRDEGSVEVPVLTTVATTGEGVAAVVELFPTDPDPAARTRRSGKAIKDAAEQLIRGRFAGSDDMDELAERVASGEQSANAAAAEWLRRLDIETPNAVG